MSPEEQAEQQEAPKDRHAGLRANPGKRRAAYWVLILLGLGVLALSLVDIFVLDATMATIVYVLYAILIVVAIILMFSRRRDAPAEEAPLVEQAPIPQEMQRALLQCPDCKSVFEFGEIRFHDNKRTAFSCPVCGVYSKLPDPDQEPVKVLRPEGEYKQVQYHCNHCNEDIAIGTFGDTPLHLVRFRACPHCGQKGHIVRTGVLPPTALDQPDWNQA